MQEDEEKEDIYGELEDLWPELKELAERRRLKQKYLWPSLSQTAKLFGWTAALTLGIIRVWAWIQKIADTQ